MPLGPCHCLDYCRTPRVSCRGPGFQTDPRRPDARERQTGVGGSASCPGRRGSAEGGAGAPAGNAVVSGRPIGQRIPKHPTLFANATIARNRRPVLPPRATSDGRNHASVTLAAHGERDRAAGPGWLELRMCLMDCGRVRLRIPRSLAGPPLRRNVPAAESGEPGAMK